MLDVTGVKISTVQVGGLGIRRRPSGLAASVIGGMTLALGLDPEERDPQWMIEWGFAVKVANPGSSPIAIEAIEASWRGARGFRARSMGLFTYASRGITSIPNSPPPYIEAHLFPLLVSPGEEGVFIVRTQMELGRRTKIGRFSQQPVPQSEVIETNESIDEMKILLRTHMGRTAL